MYTLISFSIFIESVIKRDVVYLPTRNCWSSLYLHVLLNAETLCIVVLPIDYTCFLPVTSEQGLHWLEKCINYMYGVLSGNSCQSSRQC